MPSACETTATENSSQQTTNGEQQQQQSTLTKGNGAAAAGFIDDDVDYEMPTRAKAADPAPSNTTITVSSTSQSNGDGGEKSAETTNTDDFIFIQDTGFNVKIAPPAMESFELQVCLLTFTFVYCLLNYFVCRSLRWSLYRRLTIS